MTTNLSIPINTNTNNNNTSPPISSSTIPPSRVKVSNSSLLRVIRFLIRSLPLVLLSVTLANRLIGPIRWNACSFQVNRYLSSTTTLTLDETMSGVCSGATYWLSWMCFVWMTLLLRAHSPHKRKVHCLWMLVWVLVISGLVLSIIRDYYSNNKMVDNISKVLFGQDTALDIFSAHYEKKVNLFVIVGPSGVGKTMFVHSVAKELQHFQQKNLYSLRLSDLSSKVLNMYLHDVEQLFNKHNRNSVAYFVEIQCKNLPGCVVHFDDFHVFAGLWRKESEEFVRRLDAYATERRNTIFFLTVESSSIMSPKMGVVGQRTDAGGNSDAPSSSEQSGNINDNYNHANHKETLIEVILRRFCEAPPLTSSVATSVVSEVEESCGTDLRDLNVIVKQRLPALEKLHNYTLLPFVPLSKETFGWENVLPDATQKKLMDGGNRILKVLRIQHHLQFSPFLTRIVLDSVFNHSYSGGMRMINIHWFPLLFQTIKYTCPRTCNIYEELYVYTDGHNLSCKCRFIQSFGGVQALFLMFIAWVSRHGTVFDLLRTVLSNIF